MRRCDEEKMKCRFCAHAEKQHIGAGRCEEYPDEKGKPRDVYFDNAPCPKFKEGEDLLPYENTISILLRKERYECHSKGRSQ